MLHLLVSLVLAAPAPPDPAPPAAPPDPKALHAQGLDALRAGRFDDAARLFAEAYAIDPAPALLWNEARALHQGGHLVEARDLYRAFIQLDAAPADLRVKANEHIVAITLALEPQPTPPPAPDTSLDVAGWVLVGSGTALAIAGTASWLGAAAPADTMGRLAAPIADLDDAARRARFVAARDDKRTFEGLAWAGWGLGAAALGTGVALLVSGSAAAPSPSATLAPEVGPGLVGATLRLAWP